MSSIKKKGKTSKINMSTAIGDVLLIILPHMLGVPWVK